MFCKNCIRRDCTGISRPERVRQSPHNKPARETPVASPRNLNEPNEYVTMSLAAEAERQRLLDLVTLLNRRLDKEATETDRTKVPSAITYSLSHQSKL